MERVQSRAARVWSSWEEKDRGWQKKVVEYGNHALRRIPYEEWGLKSVPPLSTRRRDEEMKGTSKVELVYPKALIPTDKVSGVLEKMGTEGEALHRRRLLWCFVGMPLTLPIALIPLWVHRCANFLYCSALLSGFQSPQPSLLLSCISGMVSLAGDCRRQTHPISPPEPAPHAEPLAYSRRRVCHPETTPFFFGGAYHRARHRWSRERQIERSASPGRGGHAPLPSQRQEDDTSPRSPAAGGGTGTSHLAGREGH